MLRFVGPLLLIAASVPLAGCNEPGGAMASPAMVSSTAPTAYRMPPDAPCSNEISQFHNLVKSDLATGNLEQKVYDRIERELSRAAAACSAGKGSQAHAIVAGAKVQNGYRA